MAAVARTVWGWHHPEAPLISEQRQAQLEAAVQRLDRFPPPGIEPGPGVGMALLIDVIAGDWADVELWPEAWKGSRPRSLGAIAICLRKLANLCRRDVRGHRRARRRRQRRAGS